MSIFDQLFEKVTGGRKPVANTPTPDNNTTVPNTSNTPTTPTDQNASPLANYKDLWQTPVVDPSNPQPDREVRLSLDPTKLREAVGKIDFSKALKPEDLTAAAKGDATAMAAIINQAGQAGMAQMLSASTNMMETALAKQAAIFQNTILPEMLAKAGDRKQVASKLNIANNPVFAPLVSSVSDQIRLHHPTATDTEVAEHAQRIFSELGKELTGNSEQGNTGNNQSPRTNTKEIDWVAYMQE